MDVEHENLQMKIPRLIREMWSRNKGVQELSLDLTKSFLFPKDTINTVLQSRVLCLTGGEFMKQTGRKCEIRLEL